MERNGVLDQYLREIRLRPDSLGHQLEGPDVLPFGLVGGQDMPLQILNRVERLIVSIETDFERSSTDQARNAVPAVSRGELLVTRLRRRRARHGVRHDLLKDRFVGAVHNHLALRHVPVRVVQFDIEGESRSEEASVGKECVSTYYSRGSPSR